MGKSLTCEDSELLLAAAAVSPLEAEERRSLAAHLERCARCRRVGAEYRETADRMALASPVAAPPAALRSRIMAQVHADVAERARPPWYRRLDLRAWVRPSRLSVIAACSAAVAAAIWAVAGLRGAGPPPEPAPQPTLAYTVTGTSVQPLVRGTVAFDPAARRAVVDVQNLAPPPVTSEGAAPGTYELWLIQRDGHAVAAGFLAAQPGGRDWSTAVRADLRQYQALAASLERPGGNETPLGAFVLVVDLSAG